MSNYHSFETVNNVIAGKVERATVCRKCKDKLKLDGIKHVFTRFDVVCFHCGDYTTLYHMFYVLASDARKHSSVTSEVKHFSDGPVRND